MPILPNARLVAQLQRRSENLFYGDTALLLQDVATGAYDDYNNPVITTTQTRINCSYSERANEEQWLTYGDIGVITGEIRFAGPTPTKGNRIIVTSRFCGFPFTGETMEIAAIQDRAAMGFVCALKAVSV